MLIEVNEMFDELVKQDYIGKIKDDIYLLSAFGDAQSLADHYIEGKGYEPFLQVFGIEWDTSEEDGLPAKLDEELPTEVGIPIRELLDEDLPTIEYDMEAVKDRIADWLSDHYGWCVYEFMFVER